MGIRFGIKELELHSDENDLEKWFEVIRRNREIVFTMAEGSIETMSEDRTFPIKDKKILRKLIDLLIRLESEVFDAESEPKR